jgi:hypothetical protein
VVSIQLVISGKFPEKHPVGVFPEDSETILWPFAQ